MEAIKLYKEPEFGDGDDGDVDEIGVLVELDYEKFLAIPKNIDIGEDDIVEKFKKLFPKYFMSDQIYREYATFDAPEELEDEWDVFEDLEKVFGTSVYLSKQRADEFLEYDLYTIKVDVNFESISMFDPIKWANVMREGTVSYDEMVNHQFMVTETDFGQCLNTLQYMVPQVIPDKETAIWYVENGYENYEKYLKDTGNKNENVVDMNGDKLNRFGTYDPDVEEAFKEWEFSKFEEGLKTAIAIHESQSKN